MNKQQKEVLQSQLNSEQKVLSDLKNIYKKALNDINNNIATLQGRTDVENLQSIVYQLDYQNALKTQVSGVLDELNGKQFTSISEYLTKCYDDGFLGTMYDLHGQEIPLMFPIDQKQVITALQTETKLSKTLYKSLGEHVDLLKQRVSNSISRGLVQGSSYAEISKNIAYVMVGDYSKMRGGALYRAMTITRTEGHRIFAKSSLDAQKRSKEAGADVVKQWDATLDGRTRPNHARLDGQIREIDESFEVNGRTAMYPGGFGVPSEDVNCRCAALTRAKWALDEDELNELKERAEYYGLDKTEDFEDFKKKYMDAVKDEPAPITKPFEGKEYSMTPDGKFVETKSQYQDTFDLSDITSDKVTTEQQALKMSQKELEKYNIVINDDGTISLMNSDKLTKYQKSLGSKWDELTYTLNEDGTYSIGSVKHQAQFKIDVKNNKVLNLDVSDEIDKHIKNFGDNFNDAAKFEAMFNSLPKDIIDEIADTHTTYGGAAKLEDVTFEVLKNKGYEAIHVINTNSSTYDKISEFIQVLDDSKVVKTKKSKLETLGTSLATQQKKLAKIDNKTYTGIWQSDVKVSDYPSKKNSIQAKKDWYNLQLSNTSLSPELKLKYTKYLDDLDEFEKLGEQYEAIDNKIVKIKKDIAKYSPKSAPGLSDAAFTKERKDAALWFDEKHGGFYEADKYFDPPSKKIHSSASPRERDGFYTYTQGSGGHNRPLAGFQKPYSGSWDSGWEEKYYVGPKKVWIDYEGKGEQIRGLTELISKSTYDRDVWLQSGQDFRTIEGFLGIPYDTLSNMSDSELQQFVGRENVIYNFLSAAVNKGGGGIFNDKPLKINLYAPEGTQMLYASDVGAFEKGENETILQRGGYYRITKMYWGKDATDGNKRKMFVDMEIHPEKGYDLFQQDPNEWRGSKRNYRSP